LDKTGATVPGAKVTLFRETSSPALEVLSGADGGFSFGNVSPGQFQVLVSAAGFAPQTLSGVVNAGETSNLGPIALTLAVVTSDVDVTMTREELAEQQVKDQEQQRVLGLLPNFFVSYLPDALPLTSKQKFELAFKSSIDPVNFVVAGAAAGFEQAFNGYSGFGQGGAGYAKRFGANYADSFIGTTLGGAVFPVVFKQDPRYFYKGTGSTKSRIWYAITRAVVCKGDNGKWQPSYSGILGDMAAGAISNLYYPAKSRNGAGATFENMGLDIAGDAVGNLVQEFVLKRLTPHAMKAHPDPQVP
jgi:hypothetical protein